MDYANGHSRKTGIRFPNRFEVINKGEYGICWLRTRMGEIACFVDVVDIPMLSNYTWTLGSSSSTRYAFYQTNRGGKRGIIAMHRVLLGLGRGDKSVVDHKNHDGLDNRRANIRAVDASTNAYNIERPSKTGLRGVVVREGTGKIYRSQVMHHGKKKSLGSFYTPEEAHAVSHAYLVHHGLIPIPTIDT